MPKPLEIGMVVRRNDALRSRYSMEIDNGFISRGTPFYEWVCGQQFINAAETASYLTTIDPAGFLKYLTDAFRELRYARIIPVLACNEDGELDVLVVTRNP